GLLEHLQALRVQLEGEETQTSEIPAGPCKARDEPAPERVTDLDKDDGGGRSGCLASDGRRCPLGHDHVHLQMSQGGSKSREPLQLPLRPSELDGNVVPFNPTTLTHAL